STARRWPTRPGPGTSSPRGTRCGSAATPSGANFKGLIDEVRVYNRALSAAEVGIDMNTPVGGGTGAQHLAAAPITGPAHVPALTPAAAAALVPEALARWQRLGVPAAVLRDLRWELRVTDLPGTNAGFAAG